MKQTTPAYREAMEQPMREAVEAEVVFQNIDPEAALDGEWTDNGCTLWTDCADLSSGMDYGRTVYTLELNRCLLDDPFVLLRGPEEKVRDGFVSDKFPTQKSGGNAPKSGVYPAGGVGWPYDPDEVGDVQQTMSILTRKFSKPRTFPGITVVFDRRCGEWPRYASVIYIQGGRECGRLSIKVAGVSQFLPLPARDVEEVRLSFWGMLPGHRCRVESVLFGVERVFGNRDLVELSQRHDVDPLARRLPKEEFSFTVLDFAREYDLENPDGVWQYIAEKAPVRVRFGIHTPEGVQWTRPDRYLLNGRPAFLNNQVTFKATGLLGAMDSVYYKDVLGEKTLYDMAQAVLRDAHLLPAADGSEPWEISTTLRSITTTGVLPIVGHASCLQIIAHAGRCRLYTDDENRFHLEPFDPETGATDFVLDFGSITEGSQQAAKLPGLRTVEVKCRGLTPEQQRTVLFEGSTDETVLHIEFRPAQQVEVQASGGRLLESRIYAQAADLKLSAGTKQVTVTGVPLRETSTVFQFPVQREGAADTEQNPLITDEKNARALAQHTADYLKMRNTYDMEYRGNPELETGDVIETETRFLPRLKGLVLTDEITFNGALHGRIKLKGLNHESRKKESVQM